MTINYGRIFLGLVCVVLALVAMWFQVVMLALSTEGGPLPPGGVLQIGAIIGGPLVLLAFLVSLFGGLRFAVGTAGSLLVLHLLAYGLLIAALAPTPTDSWAVSRLNPYPVPLGVALLILALGLAVVLIRVALRKRRPPLAATPPA